MITPISVALLSCLFGAFSYSGPVEQPDSTVSSWILKSEEDIRQAVIDGVPKSIDPQQVVIDKPLLYVENNCPIPFLRNQLNGRQLWKVSVSLRMELTSCWRDSLDDHLRQFELVFDPVTGGIISASSVMATDCPMRTAPVPVDEAESSLVQMKQRFVGLPQEEPGVSFLTALNTAIGDPCRAKEIYIWYIDYSGIDPGTGGQEKPHPIWWVDMRGIPPIDQPAKTNLTSLVDSRSGELLLVGYFGL